MGYKRHSIDGVEVDSVPPEFALVPYGAFTTFSAVEGSVLAWSRHVARLQSSVHELWGHRLDAHRVADAVRAHLTPTEGAATVRVTVYPGELDVVTPRDASGARVLVSSTDSSFPFPPITDFSVQTIRHSREFAEVKSTGILSQVKLRREAQLAGFDDVLFVVDDVVLEGATWSVLVWKGDVVVTPDSGVLSSITVSQMESVATHLGRALRRRQVTLEDLAGADLVMAVSVNNPARAISRLDDQALRVDGTLLSEIAEAFSTLPREQI